MLHAADYSKMGIVGLQSKVAESKQKDKALARQMMYVS